MGTNDGSMGSVDFITGYRNVLDRLRVKYPGIRIACMVPFNQMHSNDIKNAITNIPECVLIETDDWAKEMKFADGTHPLASDSEIAATKLAQRLIEKNLI